MEPLKGQNPPGCLNRWETPRRTENTLDRLHISSELTRTPQESPGGAASLKRKRKKKIHLFCLLIKSLCEYIEGKSLAALVKNKKVGTSLEIRC